MNSASTNFPGQPRAGADTRPFVEVNPLADSRQPGHPGWLRVDPGQLERFADELDSLIVLLERILAKEEDAAVFRSPSLDPATLRTQAHLAGDAHATPDTPVGSIRLVIDELTRQVEAARLAARDYQVHEDSAAATFQQIGERE